ncbi:nucleophile aminohydrolase [Multifurca ochricompacta]|uniref:proteasome endopeptidase complex n=1 Tax=Multifurca ochricompacta TaxID=376703 RepID=A0AAD4QN21_9AGAM|nr:nucleophile aminohydrolase [Multifurca ochricompacta]
MSAAIHTPTSGFDFSNANRNAFLESKGVKMPKATSTGTTIVGCLFKDGIVLGADTRATAGPIVADKNCEKIHYISESIRCCGAGTAADTEFITALISSNIELHALSTGRKPRVVTAMTMLKQRLFQHQGQIGAALVLGGVDATGAHLFTIHPHGSTDKLPYVTMGSGSLAAMAVFESGWRPNLEREEALQLVVAAISAGIFNDLGSGSNVDACVITATHAEMLRNYVMPNVRVEKERKYGFRQGTTAWTREKVREMIVSEEIRPRAVAPGGEAMDTS